MGAMARDPGEAGTVSLPTRDAGKEKGPLVSQGPFRMMAEWTGLEPATSGVTGQHSNRLNYHSALRRKIIQAGIAARNTRTGFFHLVGAEGFEPPTLSV